MLSRFGFSCLAFLSVGGLALACSDAPNEATAEDDLLPNGSVYERDHDGNGYRVIAEYFGARGLDLAVDTSSFAPIWPVPGEKSLLLNRLGTPIYFGSMGYYHTAFDVLRTPEADGTTVVAPHAGLAKVFDWYGTPVNPSDPYSSVIAIYDPVSHVVTQLMHVKALPALASATDPIEVAQGDVIGEIAVINQIADRLRHSHVDFIDGQKKTILNPGALFPNYHDSVAPQAKRVYVADEAAQTGDKLVSGKIDVVVEAFDRDDDSDRNFELGAIAYSVEDESGQVLANVPRCSLDHVYESIAGPSSFRAKQLIDFGSATGQLGGDWPSSDIDNRERTFRYALTQLVVEDGRCKVLDDTVGHLEVGDDIQQIVVRMTLWDPKGNQTEHVATLKRSADTQRPQTPRDAGAD